MKTQRYQEESEQMAGMQESEPNFVFFFGFLFFFIIVVLGGYMVTFTKVLTIYHS
jgi:hypothetical protein